MEAQLSNNLEELRVIADKMGIQYHHKTGEAKLATLIHEASQPKIPPHVSQRPVESEVVKNTPEQVREAIKGIIANKPEFEVSFTEDTWTFRFKGAEDSGNLSIPLRVIKIKAETVSRGANKPRGVRNSEGNIVLVA